tara:strand:- start:581 stop:754 length:174 start_codon:yes stop_codon:yes gene_type:complete
MAQQSSQRRAFVTPLTPGSRVKSEKELQELDTNPSEIQPPGVDEDREPQSLEEALTG